MSHKSLFILNNNGVYAYMLVNVDDLILTGKNDQFLKEFVEALNQKFP